MLRRWRSTSCSAYRTTSTGPFAGAVVGRTHDLYSNRCIGYRSTSVSLTRSCIFNTVISVRPATSCDIFAFVLACRLSTITNSSDPSWARQTHFLCRNTNSVDLTTCSTKTAVVLPFFKNHVNRYCSPALFSLSVTYCQRLCILGHHGAIEIGFIINFTDQGISDSKGKETRNLLRKCKRWNDGYPRWSADSKLSWSKIALNRWMRTHNLWNRNLTGRRSSRDLSKTDKLSHWVHQATSPQLAGRYTYPPNRNTWQLFLLLLLL